MSTPLDLTHGKADAKSFSVTAPGKANVLPSKLFGALPSTSSPSAAALMSPAFSEVVRLLQQAQMSIAAAPNSQNPCSNINFIQFMQEHQNAGI
uniref:Jun-like transcription factor domain-containing protein n=1 Tax=Syphacia muris TaxID=451379 RepID=A0A0N5ACS8_9BILA